MSTPTLPSGIGSIQPNSNSALTSVGQAVSGATNAIGQTVSSLSSAVGKDISSIEDAASNGLSYITTPIANVEADAEKLASDAFSGVSNFLGDEAKSIGGGISDAVSGIFGAKSNAPSNPATPSDNVKSATISGPIASGVYATNSSYAQAKQVNLTAKLPQLSSSVSSLSTLASRLGQAVTDGESSILGAAKSFTHSSLITSVTGGISNLQAKGGQLLNLAHQASSAYNTVTSLPSIIKAKALSDWSASVSGLSNLVTGTAGGLNGFYNSNYPLNTNSDCSTSGDGSTIPASLVQGLYTSINNSGCTTIGSANNYSYAAEESLKNAQLAIAYTFNLQNLLKNMMSCSNYSQAIQNAGANIFSSNYGSNPVAGNIFAGVLDPSKTTLPRSQAVASVTNNSVPDSAAPAISSTFSKFGIDSNSLYQSDSHFANTSSFPVYDPDVVSASSSAMTSAMTNNANLHRTIGDGTPIAH